MISGCGTPDEVVKDGAYQYSVPDDFDVGEPKLTGAESAQYKDRSGLKLDSDADVIIVYSLEVPTAKDIDLTDETVQQSIVSGAESSTGGSIDNVENVKIAGTDAVKLTMTGITNESVKDADGELYIIKDGSSGKFFYIACRWKSDDKKEELLKGCKHVVDSFKLV